MTILLASPLYGYHRNKKKLNPSLPDVTYLCFLIMTMLVEIHQTSNQPACILKNITLVIESDSLCWFSLTTYFGKIKNEYNIYIYIYIYIIYTHIYIYIYTHTHTHIYIYVCVCVCTENNKKRYPVYKIKTISPSSLKNSNERTIQKCKFLCYFLVHWHIWPIEKKNQIKCSRFQNTLVDFMFSPLIFCLHFKEPAPNDLLKIIC